jgi:hypothetical protein
MRRTIWTPLGLLFLGWLHLSAVLGCNSEKNDSTPLFEGYQYEGFHDAIFLYHFYDKEEAEADKWFKGKVIKLGPVDPTIHSDPTGESYVVAWTIPDPSKKNGRREAIRCYLHNADHPVMERSKEGCNGYDVKGICMGKIDGVVVLRKSYLVETWSKGRDL